MPPESCHNHHKMNTPSLSIIIPVLDEEDFLGSLLKRLPDDVEVIVVDGGSRDASVQDATASGCIVIKSRKGRACQMNAGAKVASGDLLLFLHADCLLPRNFMTELEAFWHSDQVWGRFDIKIESRHLIYRLIEKLMNLRSQYTGMCTGDQAIFVQKTLFDKIGGFPDIALMEDIELSKGLAKITKPYVVQDPVRTSARRWVDGGVVRTILLMWRLRLMYFFGASPDRLVRSYYK